MAITASQRRYLRELAHALKPVVMLGTKGVTDAVVKELGGALDQHELLKVRLSGDRDDRAAQLKELVQRTGADEVLAIGGIAALYRPNPDKPKLALPR